MVSVCGESPCSEAAIERNSERHGIELLGDDTEGHVLGHHSFTGRGRRLTLGQTVDLVVMHEELHVDISPHGGHQMVASLAVTVAVAGHDDHRHLVVREPDAGGHRQRSAVKSVKGVAFGVMGELRRLAYARDHGELVWLDAELDHDLFEGLEYREVPATRAPCWDLPFIVFQGDH